MKVEFFISKSKFVGND